VPLPDPTFHSELGWSPDARILFAHKALVEADEDFASVFNEGGGLVFAELRALLQQETFKVPMLSFSLLADEESNFSSSYSADLEVIVQASLWTNIPTTQERLGGTDDFFRSRLVHRYRQIVRSQAGVLYEDGQPLTIAITRITRVNFDLAPLPYGVLLTQVNTAYTSSIDLLTQEVIS
jgi:hypothetical protein